MTKQILLVAMLLIFMESALAEKGSAFRLHLNGEPRTLDPTKMRGSLSSYFFGNIMRGLFRLSSDGKLRPEGARSCKWKSTVKLICHLNSKARWNDGSPVVAQDYVRAFRYFVSPQARSLRFQLLAPLKNARKVFSAKVAPEKLGVAALQQHLLSFEFEKPFPEFTYTLTNTLLVPLKSLVFTKGKMKTNGPYQISSWEKGRKIQLTENPFYFQGPSKQPPVEIFFIKRDSTALSLYQKGTLSFLRRLPIAMLQKYKGKPDYYTRSLARFDYLGFAGKMQDQKLRQALSLSLDYDQLQKLFHSEGRFGCPSLPLSYTDREVCIPYYVNKARKIFSELPPEIQKKKYTLYMSHFGGDSHRQLAQWLQFQWKKNLGVHIEIQQIEQKHFLKKLRTSPPDLFRKGVGLLRPTCLAALETFSERSSENYIRWKDKKYEDLLKTIEKTNSEKKRKALCRKAVERLLKAFSLIPTGRMYFSFLASPQFKGWEINELNHLDLAFLQRSSPPKKP